MLYLNMVYIDIIIHIHTYLHTHIHTHIHTHTHTHTHTHNNTWPCQYECRKTMALREHIIGGGVRDYFTTVPGHANTSVGRQ
jgi:hypothetical protein